MNRDNDLVKTTAIRPLLLLRRATILNVLQNSVTRYSSDEKYDDEEEENDDQDKQPDQEEQQEQQQPLSFNDIVQPWQCSQCRQRIQSRGCSTCLTVHRDQDDQGRCSRYLVFGDCPYSHQCYYLAATIGHNII